MSNEKETKFEKKVTIDNIDKVVSENLKRDIDKVVSLNLKDLLEKKLPEFTDGRVITEDGKYKDSYTDSPSHSERHKDSPTYSDHHKDSKNLADELINPLKQPYEMDRDTLINEVNSLREKLNKKNPRA